MKSTLISAAEWPFLDPPSHPTSIQHDHIPSLRLRPVSRTRFLARRQVQDDFDALAAGPSNQQTLNNEFTRRQRYFVTEPLGAEPSTSSAYHTSDGFGSRDETIDPQYDDDHDTLSVSSNLSEFLDGELN